MSRSAFEYLRHILDETIYLRRQTSGLSKEKFLADETLKRAFVRSIEIIGEAAKQVPEDTRKNYPDIQWRAMAGMRDRLIHGYFGIDYDIVWDVVINKIPALKTHVETILANPKGDNE